MWTPIVIGPCVTLLSRAARKTAPSVDSVNCSNVMPAGGRGGRGSSGIVSLLRLRLEQRLQRTVDVAQAAAAGIAQHVPEMAAEAIDRLGIGLERRVRQVVRPH